MVNRTIKSQINSGLLLTAKTLLVLMTVFMFWGGTAVIFSPDEVGPNSILRRSLLVPSFTVGSIFLVVSTVIMVATAEHWKTIVPGLLGYSMFGGLIMLFTGHYLSRPVPREVTLLLMLFSAASIGLFLTFQERESSVLDRVALTGFVFCMALATTKRQSKSLAALGGGLALLVLAWAIDRMQRRSARH
jgi:hypothetical protein